jgi:hypothetical protein
MKKLSEKQKKIARMAPPPDQITGADFKAMKARTGKAIKADPTAPINRVAPKVTDALKKRKLPGRIGTALGIGSMLVPAAYAAMKQYKDYKSAKNRDEAKVKKMGGGMMRKYSKGGGADTGKMGEIKSQFAVASDRVRRTKRDGDRLTQRDIDFIKKATQKRMGGGMMNKPMGYKKGVMVKARGCKLGRTRPTKIT